MKMCVWSERLTKRRPGFFRRKKSGGALSSVSSGPELIQQNQLKPESQTERPIPNHSAF